MPYFLAIPLVAPRLNANKRSVWNECSKQKKMVFSLLRQKNNSNQATTLKKGRCYFFNRVKQNDAGNL
jgi:hypothetical protein